VYAITILPWRFSGKPASFACFSHSAYFSKGAVAACVFTDPRCSAPGRVSPGAAGQLLSSLDFSSGSGASFAGWCFVLLVWFGFEGICLQGVLILEAKTLTWQLGNSAFRGCFGLAL